MGKILKYPQTLTSMSTEDTQSFLNFNFTLKQLLLYSIIPLPSKSVKLELVMENAELD